MAEPTRESVASIVEEQLNEAAQQVELALDADAIAIHGPITSGLDQIVRDEIESRLEKRSKLAVILQTPGGVVEIAERIVNVLRHHYDEVVFIVPDRAMSAGTVLVMSGDDIYMDYYSVLGPIDPQVQRGDSEQLVPALGYLAQFELLIEKSKRGELTAAEFALLQELNLAELHQFAEARELTHDLLKKWLAKYKFKDWTATETNNRTVTEEMKKERAAQIAEKLSDNQRWHSHGRGISREALKEDLNLRIEDFGANKSLARAIRHYHRLIVDYIRLMKMIPGFVHHTRGGRR